MIRVQAMRLFAMADRRRQARRPRRQEKDASTWHVGLALAATLAVGSLALAPELKAGFLSDAFTTVTGGVGRLVGAPFGGFVDGMTAPTVRNAERTGKRLISTMDKSMQQRIAQIDKALAINLQTLDANLEDRILQLDGSMADRIRQADEVLESRIEQVDDTLQDALAETDQILQRRLDQLDEIAGKRIGNLDVVATKATYTLEEAVIRIVGVSCLMVFLACAVWRIYVESVRAWQNGNSKKRTVRAQIHWLTPRILKPVAVQLTLAGVCLAILFSLFAFAPGSARSRAARLADLHRDAFDNSLATMDIRRAAYHADQLRLLRPLSREFRGLTLKAELVRDLFDRPTLLKNLGGINEVLLRIAEIERHADPLDPDVDVLKAFVLWQASPTRVDEFKAALLCHRALDNADGKTFALRALAEHYLRAYLSNPLPKHRLDELAHRPPESFVSENVAVVSKQVLHQSLEHSRSMPISGTHGTSFARSGPLIRHATEFNQLAASLTAETTQAYLEILDINARLSNSRLGDGTTQEASQRRAALARTILDAWEHFETTVTSSPSLAGSPAPLASFYLNDAIWVRARYYLNHPKVFEAAPRIRDIPANERAAYSPPRVRLAESLLAPMSPEVRQIIELQESRRFQELEDSTWQFEKSYLQFREAVDGIVTGPQPLVDAGLETVLLAADLGLNQYPIDRSAPPLASASLVDTLLETIQDKTLGVPELLPRELAIIRDQLAQRIDRRQFKFL